MKEEVVVYSKNNCPQCDMTKKLLVDKGIAFSEVNIDENTEFVAELKALGFRSVPVTMSKNSKFKTIIGFRPDLLRALALN